MIRQTHNRLKQSKWGITLFGMYCLYMERPGDIKKVDYKTYTTVIREFNSKLADTLILDAREFVLPYRLGKLRIKKYKQKIKVKENGDIDKKNMPVDWKKTNDLWRKLYPDMTMEQIKEISGKQRIFHLNEHTSGYRCFLFWDRISCNIKNNRIYSVIFTFYNRRKLANILRTNCKINYYE